jgi:hypothetical protein
MEVYNFDESTPVWRLVHLPARPLGARRLAPSAAEELQARVRALLRTNLLRLASPRPKGGARRRWPRRRLRILPNFGL